MGAAESPSPIGARPSDGLAAELCDSGVRAGDVVALTSPIDYAIAYPAIARIGAVTTGAQSKVGAGRGRIHSGAVRPGPGHQ
jgi:acyl-coenzyme A synthetase/AMP-(fatty) acid ligase